MGDATAQALFTPLQSLLGTILVLVCLHLSSNSLSALGNFFFLFQECASFSVRRRVSDTYRPVVT